MALHEQLDVYDVLALIEEEAEYALAEREGIQLDSLLCADCPILDTCIARDECSR